MTLSEELKWRGLINQTTLQDLRVLDKQSWIFYHGYDASAPSQTIGNLAAMMLDKLFIRHGHQAILVTGGSTSLIGDPSGKDKERKMQTEITIAKNVLAAEQQFKQIFRDQPIKLVNNLDWTKSLKLLDFLRDIGKHFSISNLIQRDYIAQRLGESGSGISYTEFSYNLLQAFDYLYLYDNYQVTLQLGGADQWGNCLSGVDLIRKARGAEVHTITLPLIINQSTGLKFGKTEDGAIWLDEKLTSVYQYYQFWLNTDDDSVETYLKIYTELNKDQIDNIMAEFKQDQSKRLAQKRLAYESTAIVHGQARAASVRRLSEALFGDHDYSQLQAADFKELGRELGLYEVKTTTSLSQVLVDCGLASSLTEARHLITAGAIYLNGQTLATGQQNLSQHDTSHHYLLLRRGKNQQVVVKLL